MTTLDFLKFKSEKRKISMVTCYDSTFAGLVDQTEIDCILIGDSCSMVMHGEDTTIPATMEWLVDHTKSVRKKTGKYIVGDMPFLTTRMGINFATECAGRLLQAGANCVKIEGVYAQEDVIRHMIQSGIPVMGHLGLTPQFYQAFGGHKRQGRTEEAAKKIFLEAKTAQELGCTGIVLECIPRPLAKSITDALEIPTIGIGSGPDTDGQVLVLHDLLGLSGFSPKFVRRYMDGANLVRSALDSYASDVRKGSFPDKDEV